MVKPHIILVNDRPHQDSSSEILRKRGHNVYDNENPGYGRALNTGMKHVNSEYIAFLNSDDLQSKERLSLQVQRMREIDTTISLTRLKKFGGRRPHFEISGTQPHGIYQKNFLLLGPYGANSTIVLKTERWKHLRWEGVPMEDWRFALDYYPETIELIDSDLYKYRMHRQQISRNNVIKPEWLSSRLQKLWRHSFGIIPSANVALSFAYPSLFIKLSEAEMNEYVTTLNLFYDSSKQLPDVAKILLRRNIFILKKNIAKANTLINETGFNKMAYLSEALKIFFEASLSFDNIRR